MNTGVASGKVVAPGADHAAEIGFPLLYGDAVAAFGAFHQAAEPAVRSLARVPDLRVVRELVLAAQEQLGGNDAGAVQHRKVMLLDIGVFPVVRPSLSVKEQTVPPVKRALLGYDLNAERGIV